MKIRHSILFHFSLLLFTFSAFADISTNISGVVTFRRRGDTYFFVHSANGECWRVGFDKSEAQRQAVVGDLVEVQGRIMSRGGKRRLEKCKFRVIGYDASRVPAPEAVHLADFVRSPLEPNGPPDRFAHLVMLSGKVTDINRRTSFTQLLLSEGKSVVQVAIPYPIKRALPDGLVVGAQVHVVGIYVYTTIHDSNTGEWIGTENPIILLDGMYRVVVLDRPSFWTPLRVLIAGVVMSLVFAIVIAWISLLRRREAIAADSARRERLRLAHDLHDNFQQLLASCMFRLGAVENSLPLDADFARTQLAKLEDALTHTQNGLRAALWSMSEESEGPSNLSGLFRYVGSRLAHWQNIVTFEFEGDEQPIAHTRAGSLLMILEEAVGNALRHGHATKVAVKVRFNRGELVMSVTDNGCGFDAAAVAGKGMGLSGMKMRVTEMGGEFSAESSPSHGTSIIVRLSSL